MKRARTTAAVLGAAAVIVALAFLTGDHAEAPASSIPPTPLPSTPPTHLPFGPGEKAWYTVRLGEVPIATCEISLIGAEADGSPLLEGRYQAYSSSAVSAIRPFTLTGTTLLDPATLLPSRAEKLSVKSGEEKRTITVFDRPAGVARITKIRPGRPQREQEVSIEAEHDILSALLALRANRIEPGRSRSLRVMSGDDFQEVRVTHKGDGEVTVPAGRFRAVELEVISREIPAGEEPGSWRSVGLWVERDIWLPLRFDASLLIGSGTAELTRFADGKGREWPGKPTPD